MSNVIPFKTKKDAKMEEFMDNITKQIKEMGIDNIMIASKTKEGEVMLGACNMDIGTRMELIGHLQVEVMNKIIQANYITP